MNCCQWTLLIMVSFVLFLYWLWPMEIVDPSRVVAQFEGFDFGLAIAPAHGEDHLNDSWLEWGKSGKIPFFLDIPQPEKRLNSWSQPHVEIEWAASTGVTIYRMGIDWGRLTPFKPGTLHCDKRGKVLRTNSILKHACRNGVQDDEALEHYLNIMRLVKKHGMKIMLTFFHHSLPVWANVREVGGWSNIELVEHFASYVRDVVPKVASLVDDYTVFNEPAVFANLVYGMSMWPGRLYDYPDTFAYWDFLTLKGPVVRAYANMVEAHKKAHGLIKTLDKLSASPGSAPARVGIAHYVGYYLPGSPTLIMQPVVNFVVQMMNLHFPENLRDYLDFIGLNYYGKEYVTTTGAAILSSEEYSEAGRAISPNGMVEVLMDFHKRFNSSRIPFIITENGISDETDVLRPSYLIEHLLAVKKAQEAGVNIQGYIFWTLSDNWEWADGYCPKFGMLQVDRTTMERIPRPSFKIFSAIVKEAKITLKQRVDSWNQVTHTRGLRPFCRAPDGRGTVTERTTRNFAHVDWRLDYKLNEFPKKRWPFNW